MNVLDAALGWHGFGIAPIPILFKSKRPLVKWAEYQDKLPDDQQVKDWFSNDNVNLGVVCGGSQNLVVLDFDDLKTYYAVIASLTQPAQSLISQTYRVMTSRGIHVYLTTGKRHKTGRMANIHLDIKASGGYVLTPPSVHPSGASYTSLGGTIQRVDFLEEIIGQYILPEITAEKKPDTFIQQITKEELKSSSSFYEKLYVLKKYMNILDIANMFTYMHSASPDGRWWYGRCPHPKHDDRHPSFRIDAAYGVGKCLAHCSLNTQKGFDLLDLYCAITGKKNTEALDELIAPFVSYCHL